MSFYKANISKISRYRINGHSINMIKGKYWVTQDYILRSFFAKGWNLWKETRAHYKISV